MAEEKRYEISVQVVTRYLPEQSEESAGRFVFAYTITLRNTGNVTAQLNTRAAPRSPRRSARCAAATR
jgi:ApaG protein